MTRWITLAEALVKPIQTGSTVAEAVYRSSFVPSPHFEMLPVDQVISDQAASLRVSHGFKSAVGIAELASAIEG